MSMQGTLPFTLFILTLSQSLPVYSLTLAACLFSHDQALCLSILSLSLHVYFLTLRLTAYVFCTIRLTAVYSLTVRLAACLVLHCQASAYLFSHHLACCLSILTPADSLPTYSHTIRLTAIYSHTIRLTPYLFSHSSYCLSVFTPNAVKVFLLSSSPMYSCTLGLTAYVFSLKLATYLVPHPDIYIVPTIRFAAYLASCAALPQPDSPLVYCHT